MSTSTVLVAATMALLATLPAKSERRAEQHPRQNWKGSV
jgi:hypothetical protein